MAESFKDRLKAGRPALACLANMGSPVAAEILACAGYDAVMVDLEHGPGDVLNAVHQFQAIAAANSVPLVRVPANDAVWLKRVLDAGPHAVMVPAVNNAEEAAAVVEACRYPPDGIRGVAHSVARASGYGTRVDDYIAKAEKDLLIICQVETVGAVEKAGEIAAVDGVDMLLVGPMDLSASAGHFNAPDHAEVDALMARVEAAAKDAGKLVGTMATPGRRAPDLFKRGHVLVLDTVDVALLRDGAKAKVEASRKYTKKG